ncbi:MAG: hypothetical protein U0470_09460 [Anaerolineae bacterium]
MLRSLAGKVDGMAYRVPVPDGSVIDIVCQLERATAVAALNERSGLRRLTPHTAACWP